MMNIREYNGDKDFPVIRNWITDERTHAMWCANRTDFPLQKESFDLLLNDMAERFGDKPYVAVDGDGTVEGFFCYSLNQDTQEGMLKYVMVDPARRGRGLGREMIRHAVQYAFDVTGADAVHLMVFSANERARKCYESVGFTERHRQEGAVSYDDEDWDRINMVLTKGKDMSDQNPWEKISLDDYEKHMSLDSVQQLQKMNAIMKDQFEAYPVRTAMVLGVAGGNGLEHVRTEKYQKVYGIDINEDYLRVVSGRYKDLGEVLQCMRVDVANDADLLPQAELVIANLLIEYIGYSAFQNVIQRVKPEYVSCVIQINTDTKNWVSDSPYIHAFDDLDRVHCQMEEEKLIEIMDEIHYSKIKRVMEDLPNGKALLRLDFTNEKYIV
jgi:RimJ/RimL family protein N-acetyltransferase